mgnify:CR=1 FL=1
MCPYAKGARIIVVLLAHYVLFPNLPQNMALVVKILIMWIQGKSLYNSVPEDRNSSKHNLIIIILSYRNIIS